MKDVKIPPNTDFNKTNLSLEELLIENRIKAETKVEPPSIVLSVINDDGTNGIIGTKENFVTIIGKAKSRKSTLISFFVASLIKNEPILDFFIGKMPKEKTDILYFDTEQSGYHLKRTLKRILNLANLKECESLHVYKLRKFNAKERLNMIIRAIEINQNIGVIIIDGLRDLVTSINDEQQATDITSFLMKWTEEKGINLITVLHQNKGDNHARGHLGTELTNKSETILSVEKAKNDKSISVVKAEFCRDKEPDTFAFSVDENEVPYIVTDWESKVDSNYKVNVGDIPDERTYEVCKAIFSDASNENLKYSELKRAFKIAFKQVLDLEIGINKAVEFITYCKEKDWITQKNNRAPYQLGEFNK